MFFSVVIPTFNRASLVERTLASVRQQQFTAYEVIVVDDGSTDQTQEVMRGYPWVKMLTQNHSGPGAARNLGARQAKGKYLAFLDSDDVWFPWTLQAFADLITHHTFPAILRAKVFEFSRLVEIPSLIAEPATGEVFDDYFASSRKPYPVGAGMAVIRREEFIRSGGFVEERINGEDHDLMMRLGTAQGFVQVQTPFTLGYYRHEISETSQLKRNFSGNRLLIDREKRNEYPGGSARVSERRELLCRTIRPVALSGLRQGFRREAAHLYRMTFSWHVALGRWRFLLGFPALAIASLLYRKEGAALLFREITRPQHSENSDSLR